MKTENERAQDKLQSMKNISMPLFKKNEYHNIATAGESYTGKTHALITAPRPIVIDVFDKTALPTLRPLMNEKDVYINLYTDDNPDKPTMFKDWAKNNDDMAREGVFDVIETYAIDSLTKIAECLLWQIIDDQIKKGKSRRTPVQVEYRQPTLNDYGVQGEKLRKVLNRCVGYPCNFILTCHVLTEQIRDDDKDITKIINSIFITPKLGTKVPTLFDEVYISENKRTSKGKEYYWVTQDHKDFTWCGTRYPEVLEKQEPQDFTQLFEKLKKGK